MKNIVFTRIDDRLIHGQVMTAWIQYTQATEVVIVDDKVAKDEFIKMVMKSSMPAKIHLTILDTQSAINYLLEEPKDPDEKVFIIVKQPMVLLNLINAKVDIKQIGIGGMGARADRTQFYRNISATDEERNAFLELSKKGVDVFIQVITDDKRIPLKSIL